jgi:amino acid transporter
MLILLPAAGLWFYKGERVKSVFEEHDTNIYWTEKYPFPLLSVLLLFIIMIFVMHLTIFFQGLFPNIGKIMLGRSSVYVIAFCTLILGILFYGTIRLEKWAWWGSVILISMLVVSSAISFSRYSFYDLIQMMSLPAYVFVRLSECRKVFENQKEPESGIRAGFAVLLACFS